MNQLNQQKAEESGQKSWQMNKKTISKWLRNTAKNHHHTACDRKESKSQQTAENQ